MAEFAGDNDMIPSTRKWTYDVVFSFQGQTCKNFTDNLYLALSDAGVNVFSDKEEFRRGEEIASELLKAIENSRISIIVFSADYASSRRCLEELAKIMECKKIRGHMVLPIFNGVDPSDVRHQRGNFAEAFAKHEDRFKEANSEILATWRTALTDAANLSGWGLNSTDIGQVEKCLKQIVKLVVMELNQTHLLGTSYPVGLESRVQYVNVLLNIGSNDVRVIGICGVEGVGKTTVAKAIYNQLFHGFDGKSFLGNVREMSRQHNGLVILQEQMLFDVLRKRIQIHYVDRGINLIKERLSNLKVLVVIDDVNDVDQINALARQRDCFGLGSRLIISTRDEHLLRQIEVDATYMVEELDDSESLRLLSWHAFKESHPPEAFFQVSKDVSAYCNGLPLALEVLASFLFSKSIDEWNTVIEELRKTPPEKLQEKLKIRFNPLDSSEKGFV